MVKELVQEEVNLSILLPTYNESANVAPLLRAINKALSDTGTHYEIIFIDDSSDITPDVIARMQSVYPNVHLIHRPVERRTGLATALIEGFSAAKGEYIVCMDSDLQHPPKEIPKLFTKALETNADVVVATRYAAGGSAEGLGSLYRRAVSHICRFASWMLIPQTRKTTDPGSGFFIFRKSIVHKIDFRGLRGFKILIDILARTRGLKVSEIPIVFLKRTNDESKATVEQGLAFIRHLITLKYIDFFSPKAVRGLRPIESAVPVVPRSFDWKRVIPGWITDLSIAVGIALVGWYLIGYYAAFNYLYTGYEDWIYHAFRVKSLQEHGMVAWDHIWSNGINYWKLYQYVAHFLILGVVNITGLSITKVLLLSIVTLYIGLRVALYFLLRALGVQRIFALLSVVASYTIVQEWGSMQDYSIYVAFITFPLYLMLWILTFRDLKWIYVLAAVTGAIWTLHPVLGFNASILLGFLCLFSHLKSDLSKIIRIAAVYFLAATPFLASYFTAGYFFTNPLFKSYIYLSTSVLAPYGGFSMIYWILFGISWILVVWRSSFVPTWTKVLLVYASFYLVLVYLGQKNYLPNFLVQFQFSRGLTAVAFSLVFVFASVLQHTLGQARLQSVRFVAVVLIATTMVHAVDIASRYYVSPPVNEIQNAVAAYFQDRELPKGSVFTENVSEASYFAPAGIRYVTSYNEHMQPHPYSTRLRVLMHSRLGYTGISNSHISNVENYATVLGIEYLFLPANSPLVKGLTEKEGAMFELVEYVDSEPLTDSVAVLRNTQPITTAFAVDRNDFSERLLTDELTLPTIHISSYKRWDDRIAEMADLMRSDKIVPLETEFISTNGLKVSAQAQEKIFAINDLLLVVNQSYDSRWEVVLPEMDEWSIQPTTLRFMAIDRGAERASLPIELKNEWPWWHFPVQSLGLVAAFIALLWTLKTSGFRKRIMKNIWRRYYANK